MISCVHSKPNKRESSGKNIKLFVATYIMTRYVKKYKSAPPRSFDATSISTNTADTPLVMASCFKSVDLYSMDAIKNTKVSLQTQTAESKQDQMSKKALLLCSPLLSQALTKDQVFPHRHMSMSIFETSCLLHDKRY